VTLTQPISVTERGSQPYPGKQDIIPVPYKKNGVPGQVVIRIDFTDFTGRVMFHCHIAAHEDAGMMSFINVVDPGLQRLAVIGAAK
jgi:FtsP/CotA-like multicopper oxidase with cupredoxin domain